MSTSSSRSRSSPPGARPRRLGGRRQRHAVEEVVQHLGDVAAARRAHVHDRWRRTAPEHRRHRGACASPPTISVSDPFSAAAAPPEIPASRNATSRRASASWIRHRRPGVGRDRSTTTCPTRACASRLPPPIRPARSPSCRATTAAPRPPRRRARQPTLRPRSRTAPAWRRGRRRRRSGPRRRRSAAQRPPMFPAPMMPTRIRRHRTSWPAPPGAAPRRRARRRAPGGIRDGERGHRRSSIGVRPRGPRARGPLRGGESAPSPTGRARRPGGRRPHVRGGCRRRDTRLNVMEDGTADHARAPRRSAPRPTPRRSAPARRR